MGDAGDPSAIEPLLLEPPDDPPVGPVAPLPLRPSTDRRRADEAPAKPAHLGPVH